MVILGIKGLPLGGVIKIFGLVFRSKASFWFIISGNKEAKCQSSPIPSRVTSKGFLNSVFDKKFSVRGKKLIFVALFFMK